MPSTNWTRNDSTRLGEIACQVGLTAEEAEGALALGARFHALGFNEWEIQYMIQTQYQLRVDLERGYDQGTITPSDFRKLREIRGW